MNKINSRGNLLLLGFHRLKNPRLVFKTSFSKDVDDDKKVPELDIEERYKARKGVLHDKTQSIQEESYFHKEEVDQLKALKQKKNKNKKNPKGDQKE